MKTLIINGSPKKNGDTTALIDEFVKNIKGEVRIISCYSQISPCIDCRFCWSHKGCSIKDEMQEIYHYIEECDNVVLASPIWYSSLSGPLLNIASRLQTIYAGRRFRHERIEPTKNGVLILVGGEKGTEMNPEKNALTIMKNMYVRRPIVATIYSLDTDNIPAKEDKIAIREVGEAAKALNNLNS